MNLLIGEHMKNRPHTAHAEVFTSETYDPKTKAFLGFTSTVRIYDNQEGTALFDESFGPAKDKESVIAKAQAAKNTEMEKYKVPEAPVAATGKEG